MSIISNVRIGTLCSLLLFWRNLPGVDSCGSYLHGTTGMITFPEIESYYPHKTDCTWYVTAPYNADSFLLTFSRFDINDKRTYNHQTLRTECNDYLQILRADDSTMMHRCGKLVIGHGPLKIEVRGNSMTVHFHSDSMNTGKGFSFTWKVNKWRSTTPQITTTTTPQPTTTTSPQTTTTKPTTTTATLTTPQPTTTTATTTTPQPTTATTTTLQPTTTKPTTTTATLTTPQPTTTKPTTTGTSTTPQPTTTTATTTTPQPTAAKNTLTTTSIKEAITTTASAITCVPATFVENSTTTPVANSANNEDTPGALILGYAAFSISLVINIITCFFLQRRVGKREETYMSTICRPQAPVQPTNYESLSPYDDVIIVTPSTSGNAKNMTRMYSEVTYEEPQKTIQTNPMNNFSKDSDNEAQIRTRPGKLRPGRMKMQADILQLPEIDNEYIEITI